MAISDFTLIPVGVRPTQVCPPLGKDATVTLYNQDITNIVYVSKQQWFAPGTGVGAPIQPLTSAVLPADSALYAATLAANVQPLAILPEGGTLSPSPAQIAQQISALGLATEATQVGQNTNIPNNIAATGVPLLTKSSQLVNQGALVIANGGSTGLGTFSLTQIGYEIFFDAVENSNVGPTPLNGVSFALTWSDSTTGKIVATDIWNVAPGALGNPQAWAGVGPTKGDTVQIQVTNNDTVGITIHLVMLQNSRVYTRDDIRNTTANAVIANQQFVTNDLASNYLCSRLDASALSGSTLKFILPVYCGRVKLHMDSNSNAADGELVLRADTDNPVTAITNIFYDKFTDSTGNLNDYTTLPRSQCSINYTNHNAANKTMRITIVIEEY